METEVTIWSVYVHHSSHDLCGWTRYFCTLEAAEVYRVRLMSAYSMDTSVRVYGVERHELTPTSEGVVAFLNDLTSAYSEGLEVPRRGN